MAYITPGFVSGQIVLCRSRQHNLAVRNGLYLRGDGSTTCAFCHRDKVNKEYRARVRRISKALDILRKIDSGDFILVDVREVKHDGIRFDTL